MQHRLFVYMQYFLPKHLLSAVMGWFANCKAPWLKNWMIKRFIKQYHVNMSLALIQDPEEYPDFNTFFIRKLRPELRPISAASPQEMICPVDGAVAQIGRISQNQLLQAKEYYLNLTTLLGNAADLVQVFNKGSFATFYLAPKDYHRVHMPLSGSLVKTIFVPGKLFSVNRITSELVPGLFGRNERLISIFNTAAGPMAVILIGAMLVGSIQTAWAKGPVKTQQISITGYKTDEVRLSIGEELGYFTLGSTVILLFGENKVAWMPGLKADTDVLYGQVIAKII